MATESRDMKEASGKRNLSLKRVATGALKGVGAVIVLLILLVAAATWYLTPGRLTGIINREASKNLYADVTASNVRFTLWSTFPHFHIDADSLYVRSRTFDSLPENIRLMLPENADYLCSTGKISGGINILSLLKGEIKLRDVVVNYLDMNLVAINHTLSNYDIFPTDSTRSSIPVFNANVIHIKNPRRITFMSKQSNFNGHIDLENAIATRLHEKDDDYGLKIHGNVSANVDSLHLLSHFPFDLNGLIQLHYRPFRIAMHDYSVSLGNVTGKMNMNLDLADETTLNNFSYKLSTFNVMRLLHYLPGLNLPMLRRINADLTLNASARLTAPYRFSSSALPSVEIDFNVPGGPISYSTTANRLYTITHDDITGHLIFNGDSPDSSFFTIDPFDLTADGLQLTADALMTDLMKDIHVVSNINIDADLKKCINLISASPQNRTSGHLSSGLRIELGLSNIEKTSLFDILASGNIKMNDIRLIIPEKDINAGVSSLSLSFRGKAGRLTSERLDGGLLDIKGKADRMLISTNGLNIDASTINIAGALAETASVEWKGGKETIPFNLGLNALSMNLSSPSDSLRLSASDVGLSGSVTAHPHSGHTDSFNLLLKGGNVKYREKGLLLSLRDIGVNLNASLMPAGLPPAQPFTIPAKWQEGETLLGSISHSPEYITVNPSARIIDLMKRWKTSLKLKVGSGIISTPSFPVANRISELRLEASPDSIHLYNLGLRSQQTAMRMSGNISNLRQWLNSPVPAPLRVSMDVALDTVNINQLAHAYVNGSELRKGSASVSSVKKIKSDSVTKADMKTMIVPRNLVADIRATADETRYMNLHLYNLATTLKIADGDARVDTLSIDSDFGNAFLSANYNTSDPADMKLGLKLGVMDINVVNFFKHFHTLLLMMPQMRNLEGDISAQVYGNARLFPNMYLNVPSVWADIYVQGRELTVHQDSFIRRITRMMLIHESGDLHIANMNVHASAHDNLLELYPFEFEFDRYRLRLGGLNNFNGRLYYHIGVEKSPVPFPFGINIVGMFHNPELRFGGAEFKNHKGEEITSSVMETNKVNVVSELKRYLNEFIEKAAESDTTPHSEYLFGTNH